MTRLAMWMRLIATSCLGLLFATAAPAQLLLNGAGASFPYPMYSKWFNVYAQVDPSVRFNYQSIGSGGGIKQVTGARMPSYLDGKAFAMAVLGSLDPSKPVPAFADILDDHAAISGFESVRNYADERLRNPGKLSTEITEVLKRGEQTTIERYVAAQRKAVAFKAHVDSLFDEVDVLLCPSAPGEAPDGASTSCSARARPARRRPAWSTPATRASTRSGPSPARPA